LTELPPAVNPDPLIVMESPTAADAGVMLDRTGVVEGPVGLHVENSSKLVTPMVAMTIAR
jgi:hypothetical protein